MITDDTLLTMAIFGIVMDFFYHTLHFGNKLIIIMVLYREVFIMLKKLLIPFIISICILTACTSNENAPDNAATPSAGAAVSATPVSASPTPAVTPDTTAAPTPTTAPTPVPTAMPTPVPTAVPTPLPSIEDHITETDDEHLYSYDLGAWEKEMVFFENTMLDTNIVFLIRKNYSSMPAIVSLNPDTGEFCSTAIKAFDGSGFVMPGPDNGFLIIDHENERISLYDSGCNPIDTFDTPYTPYSDSFCYDHSGRYVYYIPYSTTELRRYCYETGIVETLLDNLEPDSSLSDISQDDKKIYLFYYDYAADIGTFCEYNLETGDFITADEQMSKDYSAVCPPGETEYLELNPDSDYMLDHYKNGVKVNTILLSNSNEFYDFETDWENRVVITNSSYYSTSNIFELNCYNIDTGEKLSNCLIRDVDRYTSIDTALDAGRHKMYITSLTEKLPHFHVWDYMPDNISEYSFPRFNRIPDYIDSKRKEIEEKYNIYIYLAYETAAANFDYLLHTSTDYERIETTLDLIDEVLSVYPEGFLEQFKTDGIKTLGIYLGSSIEKRLDYQIDNAIAFATVTDYERDLALDIDWYSDIKSNIFHEISHWIDHLIESKEKMGMAENYEEQWLELNPSKAHYEYDYNSLTPFSKYTYGQAYDNAYFIDDYSLTYPTEDRARIFEKIMCYDGTGYFSSEYLRSKARFFFEFIRKTLDTENWPEETEWEKKLRLLDEFYSGTSDLTLVDIYPEYFKSDDTGTASGFIFIDPDAVG